MDRNDRNIVILGILILIVLAVAYYFLLFSPLRQEYLDKVAQRSQKEQQKQQLEQKAAQLENIRRNADNIERQILELSKRIPEQAEIPTLLVQIEEVAEESGVTQFSIEPGAPEAPSGGGDFSRIPITMSFVGRYEQMQDFMLRVRNLARLVTVNEVTYCRAPDPISDTDCPADIEIEEGEGTTRGGTTRSNNEVESQLEIEVVAEVYVQPAAGGNTAGGNTAGGNTTGGAPPPPAPAGKDKGGGAAKNGTKGGGAAK